MNLNLNMFLYNFTHSPSFSFDEWVYIGVSFFRTNRIQKLYDLHIVSKTLSGVENQDSFVSQNFDFEANNSSSPIGEKGSLIINYLQIGSFQNLGKVSFKLSIFA